MAKAIIDKVRRHPIISTTVGLVTVYLGAPVVSRTAAKVLPGGKTIRRWSRPRAKV